ncbi:MAG: FecR domain-containing protein [Proteiniphilum sp.]|uniref:FecR family protein n=1 Tax=Proteiniphilum sp. TaxID=1926877 RepID=UPI002B20D5DD|nr:FecR domain-containing protein [Proteiniphilum sp.]MEA5128159.1 FecR domain-containing protein [Proteiniphilum sp.]
MEINKYQGYKAIDFLKDDDFLRWNLFQLEEDNAYWTKVMVEGPELKSLIEDAIELYKTQVRLNDYSLTSEQADVYHDVFQHRVAQQRKRKTLFYWLSGAASVLLLLAIHQIYKPNNQDPGLLDFVNANSLSVDSDSKDIQLYVSSDRLITIEEKEADIAYNTDSIQVTGKSLAEVNATEYSQLVVPKGKRSRLTLSDGTTLHVNSGTKVVYPNRFVGDTREIYVNGEVFLDVTHNEKQPFIVRTSEIAVRVLGTKFNVQAYEEDAGTQVVLASGAVQITSNENAKKIDLIPSQMYDYKAGQASVTRVDVDKYISWVQGILYAEDERMDVLMTKLSRYYGKEILFDEGLVNQKCTGKVDLKNDLGEVLNGLTFSFRIKVEQENGTYRVSTK